MSFNVGHTTFGFTMRVPETEAATVDDLLAAHAAWMQETHSIIEEEGKLHTLEYFISKASELNDIMDPSKGTTGNTIFTINERLTSMESIQRHFASASQNDYFPEFYQIMGNYGKVIGIGGKILHSIG